MPAEMMPLLAVAHSVGRLARKFIQPLMHFGIRHAKPLLHLGAMLFKGRHTIAKIPDLFQPSISEPKPGVADDPW
jgi:hypothetical protein